MRFVRAAGRLKEIERKKGSRGISTTDLISRLLLRTETHHFSGGLSNEIQRLKQSSVSERDRQEGLGLEERLRLFATDETGWSMHNTVWEYTCDTERKPDLVELVEGRLPELGQRVIYLDGGFDLFCPCHIEFLRVVVESETRENGDNRPFVIVGVWDDVTVNRLKGLNNPLMNLLERGLCVLQCRVCDSSYYFR